MSVGQALMAFTAAAGLLTVTPGLDTALVLRTAAVEGARRAWWAGAGICLGCFCWGLTASIGLGALLAASRLAYDGLRIVGAGYLILLGGKLILRRRSFNSGLDTPDAGAGQTRPEDAWRWFVRGFLTNILNPKVGVFYVSFLPLFIPTGVAVMPFSMLLTSIHAAQGALWFFLLVKATQPLRRWLSKPRVVSTLDQGTGAVLIGFGLRLALDRDR